MPYQSKHHHERHWGPFFEEPLNVTSGALQVGYHLSTEAILNCRVGMLKDKTVSIFPISLHFVSEISCPSIIDRVG